MYKRGGLLSKSSIKNHYNSCRSHSLCIPVNNFNYVLCTSFAIINSMVDYGCFGQKLRVFDLLVA